MLYPFNLLIMASCRSCNLPYSISG